MRCSVVYILMQFTSVMRPFWHYKTHHTRILSKRQRHGWIEYSPNKVDSKIIGIDASYNSIKYQGLDLWVVTAVAVGADNSVIADLHDNGLGLMIL